MTLVNCSRLRLMRDGKFGPFPIGPEHYEAGKGLAYLIRVQGKIAGCILAKKGSVVSGDPDVWDVTGIFGPAQISS